MKDLKRQLKEKDLKKVYLFYGSEFYLKKMYEEMLKKAVLFGAEETMNFDIFEGKKCDISKIADAAETLPFFAQKRLIVVRDSGLFYAGRKEDSEKIAEYLKKMPETSCILFVESEVDKRGKLYKQTAKEGYAVEFQTPDEKSLITWVGKEFQKRNLLIEPKDSAYFVRSTANDMESMIKEMEKLASYKNNEGTVTKKEIDAVCSKPLEVKIFDLVGAIGNKKAGQALEIYRNLLFLKESPVMVLSMIIRQFRLIYQCKILQKEGNGTSQISQRLGIRDFVTRECLKEGVHFSEEMLKKALEDCLLKDIQIKTGKLSPDVAVELLIITYSSEKD